MRGMFFLLAVSLGVVGAMTLSTDPQHAVLELLCALAALWLACR